MDGIDGMVGRRFVPLLVVSGAGSDVDGREDVVAGADAGAVVVPSGDVVVGTVPTGIKSMGLKYNEGKAEEDVEGSLLSLAPLPFSTGIEVGTVGNPITTGVVVEVEGVALFPSGGMTNCTGIFAGALVPSVVVGGTPPFIKSIGLKYNEGNEEEEEEEEGLLGTSPPPLFSLTLLSVGKVDVGGLVGAAALVGTLLGNDLVMLSNVGVNRVGSLLLSAAAVVDVGTFSVVGFSVGVGNINCGKNDPIPEEFVVGASGGGGLDTPSSTSGALVAGGM